jgi:hypothetical protein
LTGNPAATSCVIMSFTPTGIKRPLPVLAELRMWRHTSPADGGGAGTALNLVAVLLMECDLLQNEMGFKVSVTLGHLRVLPNRCWRSSLTAVSGGHQLNHSLLRRGVSFVLKASDMGPCRGRFTLHPEPAGRRYVLLPAAMRQG